MSAAWKRWPACHRCLLALAGAAALLLLAFYALALRPRIRERDASLARRNEAERKNQGSTWPRDPERLQALLDDLGRRIADDRRRSGMKFQAEEMLRKATSMFTSQIQDEYGSVRNFVNQASQIEYRDQYDRLASRLEGRDVYLHKTIFGLDEGSSEEFKYQMMLKLWTVEKAFETLSRNRLAVVRDPLVTTDANKRRQAARITVLPVLEYSLDDKRNEPYLQEYRVRFVVRGELADLVRAVKDLQSGGRFLPVKQLECVHVMPPHPRDGRARNERTLRVEQVECTLVCSSFFRPDAADRAGLPVFRQRRVVVIPPGI